MRMNINSGKEIRFCPNTNGRISYDQLPPNRAQILLGLDDIKTPLLTLSALTINQTDEYHFCGVTNGR